MKLDGELGRPALEHGTMLGPPTEAERAEERARKELARKVRGRAAAPGTGRGSPSTAGPLGPSSHQNWVVCRVGLCPGLNLGDTQQRGP